MQPGLEEDELLAALAALTHLSGERASDGFGVDMLAFRPDDEGGDHRILAIEVETPRDPVSVFHLSRTPYDTAARLGARFGLLRVIKPVRGAPPLMLYVDPVRLALEPEPVVRFEPASLVGQATEVEGRTGAGRQA